jgi:hypothetical protein
MLPVSNTYPLNHHTARLTIKLATSAGYERRDEKAKRAAVNKLHISYRWKLGG